MSVKVKLAVPQIRVRPSAISLADIQRHLAKIIVLAPMAMLLIYLTIFSQPRCMSESKVVIKHSDDLSNSSLNFGLLLGTFNPNSAEDALYLKKYINSPDMLAALDKQLNFCEAFSHSGLDFLNHPSKDETAERFLKHYKDHINVSYDNKAGLLNIRTKGFSPEFAFKFSQAVLKESECSINEMPHHIACDQLVFTETEMRKARQRLDASKAELLSYQDNNSALDPQVQTQTANMSVSTLMGRKIRMEADSCNLLTHLREDAPQVISARNMIQSLQAQIDKGQSRITASQGDKLNRMAIDFGEIRSGVEFNTELYKLTLASIEKTHIGAARKLKALLVISSPQLPQESSFPNIPYLVTCWLLVCCPLFGTPGSLLTVTEDH